MMMKRSSATLRAMRQKPHHHRGVFADTVKPMKGR
jgi:hypothetical protein